jgi:hypothetical protein
MGFPLTLPITSTQPWPGKALIQVVGVRQPRKSFLMVPAE